MSEPLLLKGLKDRHDKEKKSSHPEIGRIMVQATYPMATNPLQRPRNFISY